jgi:hypothetical protein
MFTPVRNVAGIPSKAGVGIKPNGYERWNIIAETAPVPVGLSRLSARELPQAIKRCHRIFGGAVQDL